MKKILIALVLIGLLVSLSLPGVTSADDKGGGAAGTETGAGKTCTLKHNLTKIKDGCRSGSYISVDDPDKGICCLFNAIYNVVDWVFLIFIVLSVLMGLGGAYQIITSGGNTEKITAGRNLILYAVIGVVVALIAKVLPSIIVAIVT
jgi:hypothetical protein